MNIKRNLLFIVLLVALFSCARLGSPEGGPKDETPPLVLSSSPDSLATNVPTSLKELRIDFDEYVKLDRPTQQLIISPPIKKLKKIIPSNLATKYILIQWEDTLKANTTYNFNFGNSVSDNNEGNVLPYYHLVFSTGDKVDSLYLTGYVDDVLKPRTKDDENSVTSNKEKPVVVGLYQADSDNFNEKPYYVSPVDKDGYFELNYLAKGDYNLIAFQDENKNSIYDSGKEKVAFLSKPISIAKDSTGMRLLLSPPKKKFKLQETTAIPGGLLMLFNGRPSNDSLNLKQVGNALESFTITKKPKSDSAYIWIDPTKNELGTSSTKLQFSYYNSLKKKIDSTTVYYRPDAKEMLTVQNGSGSVVPPNSVLTLRANMELKDIDTSKWEMKIDSTSTIPMEVEISPSNPFEVKVKAEFAEGKNMSLLVPKESIHSFYHTNDKALLFNFKVGKEQDYGNLVIHLVNVPPAPYWMQLLSTNMEIVRQRKLRDVADIEFKNLAPDSYLVRILVDNNDNGEWDGADFEARTQPEDAYLWRKNIIVRPSWTIDEKWDFLDKSPGDSDRASDSFIPTGNDIKKIDLKPKEKDEKEPLPEVDMNNPNRPQISRPERGGTGFKRNP